MTLHDHRTDREKEAGGIPDIPTPGRLVELEYAVISDRKMRGQLRNPGEIEKTVRFGARVPALPELMFLAGDSLTPLAQWHCRHWETQALFIRIDSWQCDENEP